MVTVIMIAIPYRTVVTRSRETATSAMLKEPRQDMARKPSSQEPHQLRKDFNHASRRYEAEHRHDGLRNRAQIQ
jgi:hypothetical protein